jgi:hypothetical protein
MDGDPLKAAKDHLDCWLFECEAAHRSGDRERIKRCERFIEQCKLVISTLERRRKDRR